jgi:hypothetical protein
MEKIRPLYLVYFGGSVMCLITGMSDIYNTNSLAWATFVWQSINAIVLIYYFLWYDKRNMIKEDFERSESKMNYHQIYTILTEMLTEEINKESLNDLNKLRERLSYHSNELERWEVKLRELERQLD